MALVASAELLGRLARAAGRIGSSMRLEDETHPKVPRAEYFFAIGALARRYALYESA
jgi:hypothetical protein